MLKGTLMLMILKVSSAKYSFSGPSLTSLGIGITEKGSIAGVFCVKAGEGPAMLVACITVPGKQKAGWSPAVVIMCVSI